MLYSKQFSLSYLPLVILLPGVILHSSMEVLSSYFSLSIGKPMINFYIGGISFLLNFIFNIFMIPKYGITGAALTSTIAYSFSALLHLILIIIHSRSDLRDFIIIKKSDLADYYTFAKKTTQDILLKTGVLNNDK